MKNLTLLLLLLIIFKCSFTQNRLVQGNIVDAKTKLPIAFVSIKVKETKKGLLSDIDGNFKFFNITEPCHLIISHIGYTQKEIILKNDTGLLNISLNSKDELLDEVTVSSNLNPAHRIILLMQKNRFKNDPMQLPSFFYNAYTISELGVNPLLISILKENAEKQNTNTNKKISYKEYSSKKPITKKDTLNLNASKESSKLMLKNYLFLTEAYTERKFLFPLKSKETVLATKITGIKNPLYAVSEDDLNQFGFYADYINMLNKTYTSPVIDGSINLYKFTLREVILHEKDTTWVIRYKPKKSKNFNGLSGTLYINSLNYAIENVVASPADDKEMFQTFRLQQKYEYMNGRWFPKQLNSNISQKLFVKDSVLLYYDKRTYLSNIDFNRNFNNSDFSDVTKDFIDSAGKRTENEWKKMRVDSLGTKEIETYRAYENLPPEATRMLNGFNNYSEIIGLRAIPWGKVDIPFNHIVSGINSYEKIRLGFGVQTNPFLSNNFKIGGYVGYGLGDNAFKYGGNTTFILNKRNQTEIKVTIKQDLIEPGTIPFFAENSVLYSNNTIRNFLTYRFDSVRQLKVQFNTKITNNLKTDLWLSNEKRSPAYYKYEFDINQNNPFKREYGITEAGIGFRYTSRESYKHIGRAIVLNTLPKTRILFQISKGFKNVFGGDLDYTKAALQVNHFFNTKSFGRTTYSLDVGKIWGNVPYGYMLNTRGLIGTNNSLSNIYVPNSFQTVGVYEFNATQSANIFIQQNFGNLLLKPKNASFRPEFILVQNIGYGSINNPSSHHEVSLVATEKGLFETGLLINNIYRIKTQFFYFGLGIGYFRRYGYYKLPDESKNGAVKFGLNFSF